MKISGAYVLCIMLYYDNIMHIFEQTFGAPPETRKPEGQKKKKKKSLSVQYSTAVDCQTAQSSNENEVRDFRRDLSAFLPGPGRLAAIFRVFCNLGISGDILRSLLKHPNTG